MQFKYYVTDMFSGSIRGTNDDDIAVEMSLSEDFWVVDATTGEWLTMDGRVPVEGYEE